MSLRSSVALARSHVTNCQQVATILAALRHWQKSTTKADRLAYPHFDEIMPLDDAEINVLCEEINSSNQQLSTDATVSTSGIIDGDWKRFEPTLSDPVEGKFVEELTLVEICDQYQDLAP